MLHIKVLVFALLVFPAYAWPLPQSQSVDPLHNYDTTREHSPRIWAQSVSVIPTTDGWECIDALTGTAPSGDTWESQLPSSAAAFHDREGQIRIRTDQPDQAMSVLFVGHTLVVTGKFEVADDFDWDNVALWNVDVVGDRGSPPKLSVKPDDEDRHGHKIEVVLQRDSYHNVTFRTGPEFRGNFTFNHVDWTTRLMMEE